MGLVSVNGTGNQLHSIAPDHIFYRDNRPDFKEWDVPQFHWNVPYTTISQYYVSIEPDRWTNELFMITGFWIYTFLWLWYHWVFFELNTTLKLALNSSLVKWEQEFFYKVFLNYWTRVLLNIYINKLGVQYPTELDWTDWTLNDYWMLNIIRSYDSDITRCSVNWD